MTVPLQLEPPIEEVVSELVRTGRYASARRLRLLSSSGRRNPTLRNLYGAQEFEATLRD